MDQDANTVRPGEQLDWPRLVAWLRERLPACDVPGLDTDAEPRPDPRAPSLFEMVLLPMLICPIL